ncbi:hypothetical protein [Embleya sp. NBC_00896]|uniref:hypothetical protein n=1 Tax=Embleya sp. NBC_00896 TaxID=2975961 RepID=UPI00386D3644|nr:hypothetical protein OG928_02830 [Embleya sp. NBC_00896]
MSEHATGAAEPTDADRARALIAAGDVGGALNHLRRTADTIDSADLAHVTEALAQRVQYLELVIHASVLMAYPGNAEALYKFGCACNDHNAPFLAIPALREALRMYPDAENVRGELVAAYQQEYRYAEAVAVLTEYEAELPEWPEGYSLAYNTLLTGDIEGAAARYARMSPPEDPQWQHLDDRLRSALGNVGAARAVGPLDDRDLRGWHFVLTGGVLATLSPYGSGAGESGRWIRLRDDYAMCLHGLRRLRLVPAATGRAPTTVSLLSDRDSHILGLPALPFAPGRRDTVVVAYDLNTVGRPTLRAVYDRAPEQILFEHATCWSEPSPIAPDLSTLLVQSVVAPWGERPRRGGDGVERIAADERAVEEVARDIVAAGPYDASGDGTTAPDPDETLTAFATAIAPHWLTGTRDRPAAPGPVRANREFLVG